MVRAIPQDKGPGVQFNTKAETLQWCMNSENSMLTGVQPEGEKLVQKLQNRRTRESDCKAL